MQQNRENILIASHWVPLLIESRLYVWFVCEAQTKIPLSDPRNIANNHVPAVFEVIKMIKWKPPIVLIVPKCFETTCVIGRIIWKSGLTLEVPIVTNNNFLLTISIHCQEIKL